MRKEIEDALAKSPSNKAPGLDEVKAEPAAQCKRTV